MLCRTIAANLFVLCWTLHVFVNSDSDAIAADFFFHDGDRIVMMGDSITEQHLYSNYVEMWVTTRFPKWNLTFRNVGIGGDRSTGGNARFKRDTMSFQPTAMTVDFGMNDGSYKPFDEPGFTAYMGGLQGIADQAKAAGVRVAWCTPQPLDGDEAGPTALTGYNLTLEKYSEGVKTISEKIVDCSSINFIRISWSSIRPARRVRNTIALRPEMPCTRGHRGKHSWRIQFFRGLVFRRLLQPYRSMRPISKQ